VFLRIEGDNTVFEAREDVRHASVTVSPKAGTDDLDIVSVYVRTQVGADVQACINGVWWRPPSSDRVTGESDETSGRTGRPSAEAIRAAIEVVAAALRNDRFGGDFHQALGYASKLDALAGRVVDV
jgi:hypothetical protein